MRYLGIDYGRKRVGTALSDETGAMAFPHEVVPNNEALVAAIESLITKEGVSGIVIGHSTNQAGEDNPIHAAATEFMTDLTLATGLPVHFEPEYYSTQEAIRFQGRTDKTDAAAAAVILNSFLDKQTS